MCDVRSHISLVSFVSYWHKVSVMCPQRHKGFRCNSTTYLLTYRCKRFYHCDCVSSDTSSSTSLSGTRGSYACTSGLCSTATQQGSHTLIIHWFYDNTLHQRLHRCCKEVKCKCLLLLLGTRGSYACTSGLCSAATQQGLHPHIHWVYDNTLHERIGDARKWSACVYCVQQRHNRVSQPHIHWVSITQCTNPDVGDARKWRASVHRD